MTQFKDHIFGLIGFPLSHSFSKKYFSEKFTKEGMTKHRYELFPLEHVKELPQLLAAHPTLAGLNVTIPHKQAVIPYLDELAEEAAAIGAVNVIQIREGKLKGYNSDVYGFELSLRKLLGKNFSQKTDLKALVLGTGGASKAIVFVLKKMGIPFSYVSRRAKTGQLTYRELTSEIIAEHRLIVNCTPLGTYPKADACPDLPYSALTPDHFLFDLVYNPAETLFLQKGKARDAAIRNGLEMLHLQAERSWEIWNDNLTQNPSLITQN